MNGKEYGSCCHSISLKRCTKPGMSFSFRAMLTKKGIPCPEIKLQSFIHVADDESLTGKYVTRKEGHPRISPPEDPWAYPRTWLQISGLM